MKYDESNIFAKILLGELPVNKVYEDDNILAFHDKYPIAETHILVIPKKQCIDFHDFIINSSQNEISEFFVKVEHIAKLYGLHEIGYKIISNIGASAGQEIFHFHVHIISG